MTFSMLHFQTKRIQLLIFPLSNDHNIQFHLLNKPADTSSSSIPLPDQVWMPQHSWHCLNTWEIIVVSFQQIIMLLKYTHLFVWTLKQIHSMSCYIFYQFIEPIYVLKHLKWHKNKYQMWQVKINRLAYLKCIV